MKIIEPSFEILSVTDPELLLCARMAGLCYGRNEWPTPEAARRLIRKAMDEKPVPHDSLIEHASMSVVVVTSRAIGNQFTRHRGGRTEENDDAKLDVYTQESTRWCNMSKGKFGGEIPFVLSLATAQSSEATDAWERACISSEREYFAMLSAGMKPQTARDVLNMSLGTTIGATMSYAGWRRFFVMRCDPKHADPEIRRWASPLLAEARQRIPVVFDDVGVVE